jgi:hypothetical protein
VRKRKIPISEPEEDAGRTGTGRSDGNEIPMQSLRTRVKGASPRERGTVNHALERRVRGNRLNELAATRKRVSDLSANSDEGLEND